jgi:site-specific DNA-methyltransferase (adenine-specific)/modification methylase
MRPTFESEHCQLWLADCRDVLPCIPGLDCVITDPPFGINYANRRGDMVPKVFDGALKNDESQEVGQAIIDECFKREWPVCTFAHHRKPWAGIWRQWLVWDKGPAVGGGGDLATCWKFTWELIQVGGFGKLNGQRDSAVLRYWIGQTNMHEHPTQKPVALMTYLIKKLTTANDVVADFFMGSGTTLVSAIRAGRCAIGVESDERYFDIAVKRIQEAEGVGSLFDPTHKPEPVDMFAGSV